MSMHRQPCKDVDNNAESNNTLDVEKNVAERVRPLRIAAMQQQEALCLADRRNGMDSLCMTSDMIT